MAISFFLVPLIVGQIGIEANGYISLAGNFVTYASLLSIALNSMASRFVTIHLRQGNNKLAASYYNSVFIANIALSCILIIVFALFIVFIDRIIIVPRELVYDVRILFTLIASNFIVMIFVSNFAISTFASNKLFLTNIRTMESNILRAVLLWILFTAFTGKMYFVGLATFLSSVYLLATQYYYRKRLLKMIPTTAKLFRITYVREVIVSGVWNAITRLGQILQHGLDTLIVNVMIGPMAMGTISLSKVIPQAIVGLVGALAAVFVPDLTFDYATGNIKGIVNTVKRSMKIMSTICSAPIVIILSSGEQFYKLWVPTQNSSELYLLSSLALVCLTVSAGINVIYNVFTVVNKLKLNSITVVLNGILSTIIVIVLLKNTNFGLISVVLVSEIVGLFRVLFFVLPYGARCIGVKWSTFYPDALKPVASGLICVIIGRVVVNNMDIRNWITYLLVATGLGVVTLAVNSVVILNKQDRKEIAGVISRITRKEVV